MNKKNAEEECNSFKCFRKESVSRMRGHFSEEILRRNQKKTLIFLADKISKEIFWIWDKKKNISLKQVLNTITFLQKIQTALISQTEDAQWKGSEWSPLTNKRSSLSQFAKVTNVKITQKLQCPFDVLWFHGVWKEGRSERQIDRKPVSMIV
jgi:hypothetical protein